MMDAILLAGGLPAPDSPLFPYTQGKPKAALQIGSQSMIQWVLDALDESISIDHIIIVGEESMQGELQARKILAFLPAGEDIIKNFQLGASALLSHKPGAEQVVLVSCDIPLLTPESIDWVVQTSLKTEKDLYYPVIEQGQMENASLTLLDHMSSCGT